MANGMPGSDNYSGLTRKVLQWTERFMHIVDMLKQQRLQPTDWAHLEARNSWNGVTDVSNTVSIYKFNEAGKVASLDIYVAHLGKRQAISS